MKNLKKMLAGALALAALLMVTARGTVEAASLEDLLSRQAAEGGYMVSASSSDSKIMTLYYVGTGTEALVTIDHNSIDAFVPWNVADTDFGTSGSYDITVAAYDTLGELCDAIDALTNYGCFLTGGKRDDNSLIMYNQTGASGTNDLKAAGGFEVELDTGTSNTGIVNSAYALRVGATPQKGKRLVLKSCRWNVNGADNCKVFGKSSQHEFQVQDRSEFRRAKPNDTNQQWIEVIADDTDESVDFTNTGSGPGWVFAVDAHVVVSCGNNASAQATANNLSCLFSER